MKLVLLSILVAAAVAQENDEERRLGNLLREGNDQFTAKIYSEVVKSNQDKSVVISAFSALTPLAQLSLATEGSSHDELLRAIGLQNDDDIKAVFSSVQKRIESVQGIELKTASKIYVAEGSELNPEFAAITRDVFNSEVTNVDFKAKYEAASMINRWVENRTNDRIKDLVSPDDLGDDTSSVFVNAIYFKGEWEDPFKSQNTREEDFHVSKDKTVKVSMMHQQKEFKYADSEELNAQLLELPYSGLEASFIVILPKDVDGLAALEEKLKDPSALNSAKGKMENNDVKVSLPKFKIETRSDLKEILKKIDVKSIFTREEAHINRLLKDVVDSLYVSAAFQKAFIEVTEKGSEAAAGNEFVVSNRSAKVFIREPIEFKADHPFFFAIVFNSDPIFTGRYVQV